MSADNWTYCPRCVARRLSNVEQERTRVEAAYGMVPVTEFDAMRAAFTELENGSCEKTFREDWEIGLDGADLYVDYRGSCQTCGLKVSHKHEETVDVSD